MLSQGRILQPNRQPDIKNALQIRKLLVVLNQWFQKLHEILLPQMTRFPGILNISLLKDTFSYFRALKENSYYYSTNNLESL